MFEVAVVALVVVTTTDRARTLSFGAAAGQVAGRVQRQATPACADRFCSRRNRSASPEERESGRR